MTSRAQEGKEEQEVGSDEWTYRDVWGEPSGRLGLLMMIEVNEVMSQAGTVPGHPWKNRVIS